jgi:hypothetical protein
MGASNYREENSNYPSIVQSHLKDFVEEKKVDEGKIILQWGHPRAHRKPLLETQSLPSPAFPLSNQKQELRTGQVDKPLTQKKEKKKIRNRLLLFLKAKKFLKVLLSFCNALVPYLENILLALDYLLI